VMSCRAQGASPRAGLLLKPLAKDGASPSKQLLSNRFRTLKKSGLRGWAHVPAQWPDILTRRVRDGAGSLERTPKKNRPCCRAR
jgi:hypothetical protein